MGDVLLTLVKLFLGGAADYESMDRAKQAGL
jgi:hypothetical protein